MSASDGGPAGLADGWAEFWWVGCGRDHLLALFAARVNTLAWYHAVGSELRHVRPGGSVPFAAAGWLGRLADLLGTTPALLRDAQRFAEAYPADWVARADAAGMTWPRARALARVPAHLYPRVEAGALREGWSADEIRRRAGGRAATGLGSRRGPRPLTADYGPVAGLRTLARAAALVRQRASQNWSGSAAPLGDQLRNLLDGVRDRERRRILAALPEIHHDLEQAVRAADEAARAIRGLLDGPGADGLRPAPDGRGALV